MLSEYGRPCILKNFLATAGCFFCSFLHKNYKDTETSPCDEQARFARRGAVDQPQLAVPDERRRSGLGVLEQQVGADGSQPARNWFLSCKHCERQSPTVLAIVAGQAERLSEV